MNQTTTRTRLNKTPVDNPLVHCSVAESFNATDLENHSETHYENPMSCFPVRSGYKEITNRGPVNALGYASFFEA